MGTSYGHNVGCRTAPVQSSVLYSSHVLIPQPCVGARDHDINEMVEGWLIDRNVMVRGAAGFLFRRRFIDTLAED